MFSRFFHTFRREIVPSAISLVLWAVVLGGGYVAIQTVSRVVDVNSVTVAMTSGVLLLWVWVCGMFSWVFPLLSRFTFSVSSLNFTAIRLAALHPVRTLLLAAVNLLTVFLCVRFIFPVMVAPALAGSIGAWILAPVFRQYEEAMQD